MPCCIAPLRCPSSLSTVGCATTLAPGTEMGEGACRLQLLCRQSKGRKQQPADLEATNLIPSWAACDPWATRWIGPGLSKGSLQIIASNIIQMQRLPLVSKYPSRAGLLFIYILTEVFLENLKSYGGQNCLRQVLKRPPKVSVVQTALAVGPKVRLH